MFTHKFLEINDARVAKLADAPDLGSGGEILRGSSPLPGTSKEQTSNIKAEAGSLGVGCWTLDVKSRATLVRANAFWFPISVFRNERSLQLRDSIGDFSFPFFFTQQRQAWNAEVIFDDVAVGIRQVAELERHQDLVPHQRGAETSSESQKEHAPTTVTAECLHGRIVDHAYRYAEGS